MNLSELSKDNIEVVNIDSLMPDKHNARLHDDKNLKSIEASLKTYGQVEPLVVQSSTDMVIGGNGRLSVMKKLGWNKVTVVKLDLTNTEARALSLHLNRSSELAAWDEDILGAHLKALQEDGFGIADIGFDPEDYGIDVVGSSNTGNDESSETEDDQDDDVLDDLPDEAPKLAEMGASYTVGNAQLYCDDCLVTLKKLQGDSVDSLVCDPPAGISFMGKDWDDNKGGRDSWIAWMSEVMSEALRVMKPGAHGLVWAIPRTSHWTATALENAGFEVRDVVTHLFGSGFPKSLNISKAIDKAAGAEREVVETIPDRWTGKGNALNFSTDRAQTEVSVLGGPATDAAKQWDGWGTALKPASEHWILVRKPLSEKTVAANVLKWGTGGINIDGCRVGTETRVNQPAGSYLHNDGINDGRSPEVIKAYIEKQNQGRFPANLVLDEQAAEMLDAQSLAGGMHSAGAQRQKNVASDYKASSFDMSGERQMNRFGDSGGASRFFYVAKASKKDRSEDNTHPTVKPIKLMEYLITLVTPTSGVVLDCFNGSGTTGLAALRNGFKYIGCEKETEYADISLARWQNFTGNKAVKLEA